jgi:hypothetical protein
MLLISMPKVSNIRIDQEVNRGCLSRQMCFSITDIEFCSATGLYLAVAQLADASTLCLIDLSLFPDLSIESQHSKSLASALRLHLMMYTGGGPVDRCCTQPLETYAPH